MSSVIAIVGSLASVFGAAFAWWQHLKSKESASEAKRHVQRLLNSTQLEALSSAIYEIDAINKIMANYGPSVPLAQYSGLNYASDARQIQDLFNSVNAHVQAYSYPQEAKNEFLATPDKISALANSRRQDEAQRAGIALHTHSQSLKVILLKLKRDIYRVDM